MNKKSLILKSLAFVFGGLLYASCTAIDNAATAVNEEDNLISTDFTALVATDGWGGGWCAEIFAPAITTYDGRRTLLAENYQGNGVDAVGEILSQTITDLPNGSYTVELYANAFYTDGRGFDSDLIDGATDVAYVFANDAKDYIVAAITTATTENGVYKLKTKVTDGTLKLGLGKDKPGTNWHTIQIKQLTWNAEPDALASYQEQQLAILLTDFNAYVETVNELLAETTGGNREALTAAIATAQSKAAKATSEEEVQDIQNELVAAKKAFLLSGAYVEGKSLDITEAAIVNPTISENLEGWTTDDFTDWANWGRGALATSDKVTESYIEDFDLNQTLKNLPVGTYRLYVQGFHRPGFWAEDRDLKGATIDHTVLYAGETEKALASLWSADPDADFPDTGNYANSMGQANVAFNQKNLYNNFVTFKITEAGQEVKVGVKNSYGEYFDGSWTCFANFRLLYYGVR